jgi:hypothetical protein
MTALSASAAIPTGYYNSLNGKKEGELKTAIYNLCRNFTLVSSYSALPQYFQQTDLYPNSKRWWDMYSDIPLYAPSFNGLNREHSFPKSWWGGSETTSAYVDLNHLYPSEAAANMAKSNYPLGEVDTKYITFENGISTVGSPVAGQGGGASAVFEPADEYKGDFARTYFYMVTTYQDLTWKYTYMVSQNLYPTLNSWSIDLLLKWHRQDPVSDKEENRNDAVYKIQNNRNPFIDYPDLAEYLWGNKKGQSFSTSASSEPVGDPILVTPVQDMALDFGQVAIGGTVTSKLFFQGENLTSPISLSIYRGDTQYFSIPTKSIAASLINASSGYWLTVTYTPTALGTHTARLLISGGGIDGSRGIELRGECLAVPTLSAPTATDPTDITSTSYTANWTIPSDNVADYFIINRTKYVNGSATTEQIVAEESGTVITGFDQSDKESYTVQSVRLGYTSPESNVVYVSHAGVTGVETDLPMAIANIPGGFRFITEVEHTGVTIYDVTGKVVRVLDHISGNTDVFMPSGIYFVVSNENHRPVKVAVN